MMPGVVRYVWMPAEAAYRQLLQHTVTFGLAIKFHPRLYRHTNQLRHAPSNRQNLFTSIYSFRIDLPDSDTYKDSINFSNPSFLYELDTLQRRLPTQKHVHIIDCHVFAFKSFGCTIIDYIDYPT